jgi:hypothetical protein
LNVLTVEDEYHHDEAFEKKLESAKHRAREFSDEWLHRPGTLSPDHMEEIKSILQILIQAPKRDRNDFISIHLSIALLERSVHEATATTTTSPVNPKKKPALHPILRTILRDTRDFLIPILDNWKEATIRQNEQAAKMRPVVVTLLPPRDMLQKLSTLARASSAFQYNPKAYGIIMQVAVQLAEPSKAPMVAQQLLMALREEAFTSKEFSLLPDTVMFNMLIHAWAESKLPGARIRMEEIIFHTMPKYHVRRNVVSYNILLRYYAANVNNDATGQQEMEHKINRIVQVMKHEKIKPSVATYAQMIHGYARMRLLYPTEQSFLAMEEKIGPNPEDIQVQMLAEAAHSILTMYRDMVDDSFIASASSGIAINQNNNNTIPKLIQKEDVKQWKLGIAKRAKEFMERIENKDILDTGKSSNLYGDLMEVLARCDRHAEAESMFYNQSPNFREDPAKATVFITSCSRMNQPAKATAVLKQLIRNETVPLSIRSFNATMDAWASSTSIDAVEQCYAILRILDENPRCRKEGIRPDRITYNTLLKCLSLSSIRKDAGERAQEILNMMKKAASEQRSEEEKEASLLPDELSWNLAIKSCYQCGDEARAEAILRDMVDSDTPPTDRTYLGILHYFCSLETMDGLQKAELVLEHMKKLGETEKRSLAPNKYCYNILICGWAKSNSTRSFDRVWTLYDEITREKIEIDMAIYNTLINFYAKLDSDTMIERADRVLQDMEGKVGIYPDFRHFVPVRAQDCT